MIKIPVFDLISKTILNQKDAFTFKELMNDFQGDVDEKIVKDVLKGFKKDCILEKLGRKYRFIYYKESD